MASSDVGIYLRNRTFSSDVGIVNLHSSKLTHWVAYLNENFFDCYGFVCPENLSKFIIKRNGRCLNSEYKMQGLTNERDSFCASYCLCIIYMTKVVGYNFQSAVLNLYYQKIQ